MPNPYSDRSLRVLMLINLFMPEVYSGGERQCLRLAHALRERGVTPIVLTSRSNPHTPEIEVMGGVPVHRIWCPVEPQKGGWHLGASLIWLRQVDRWIEANRDQIDLIHCHHAKLNAWIGVRAAQRIGVPSVVKIGSAGPNFDLHGLERKKFLYGRLAARDIRRGADAFIGTSAEMLRNLRADGIEPRRINEIPNGVEIPQAPSPMATRLRAKAGLQDNGRLVIFVGRMERQKNVETLLHAWAQIPRDAPHRLVLVGDGSLLAHHKHQAQTLGLGDRVRFVGRVEDVGAYLDAADLFVLPARAEGLSNALLEAMAHGVPQVGSAVSGNTDLIEPGRTGWLYGPPEDVVGLTAALTDALARSDAKLTVLGRASRQKLSEGYSISSVAARTHDLYQTLIARKANEAPANLQVEANVA